MQADAHFVQHPYIHDENSFFLPIFLFGILDMPLSAVLDTVLLPVTVVIYLIRGSEPESAQPE